jgi:tetratricopeptide (TPR) repeat protein
MLSHRKRLALMLGTLCFAVIIATAQDLKEPNLFRDQQASAAALKAGRGKYLKKDYVGALIEYEKALRFSPNNASIHINKGIEFLKRDDAAAAMLEFQAASSRYPPLVLIYAGSGETRKAAGDYYAAILDLTIAIALRPDLGGPYGLRGECRIAIEDYEAGLEDYNIAIAKGVRIPYAYFQRARAKFVMGDIPGAIADYTLAINLSPKVAAAYYGRSLAYSLLGDREKALADQTKCIELSPRPGTYIQRAWLHTRYGDYDRALADYHEAEKLRPNDPGVARSVAMTMDIMDDRAGATKAYEAALAAPDPQARLNTDAAIYPRLHFNLFRLRISDSKLKLDPYFDDVVDWPDTWAKRIILYLKGIISAESLLADASKEKRFFPRRRQECEALYYIGFAEMLAGRHDVALTRFEECVAKQSIENYEHGLALGHLKRLTKP